MGKRLQYIKANKHLQSSLYTSPPEHMNTIDAIKHLHRLIAE